MRKMSDGERDIRDEQQLEASAEIESQRQNVIIVILNDDAAEEEFAYLTEVLRDKCGDMIKTISASPMWPIPDDRCPTCGTDHPSRPNIQSCQSCEDALHDLMQHEEIKAGWDPTP